MALVRDTARATMAAPHTRFKFVKEPFYTHTDYPWQNGVLAWRQNVDFIVDYDGQYVYPSPVYVYHDQYDGYGASGDNPLVGWEDTGTIPFGFTVNQPHGFYEFNEYISEGSSPEDGYFEATAEVACMGVFFLWNRTEPQVSDLVNPDIEQFTTFRIGVGWGDDRVLYSIRYVGRGEIKVAKSYDLGATWEELEDLRQKGEYGATFGIPNLQFDGVSGDVPIYNNADLREFNYLEVRLIAGRLMVWPGSGAPYVFDELRFNADGQPIVTINQLQVKAYRFLEFRMSGHPLKWKTECIYDSPEIPTGFYSESIDQPYVDAAGVVPAGWFANVYESYAGSLHGPIASYRLVLGGPVDGTFRGVDYSDFCTAVRAVQLFWTPLTVYNPAAPLTLEPEVIEVSHEFNVDTLQIDSSGVLLFNNNRPRNLFGFETWGEWLRDTGQVAIDVFMNRTDPNGNFGIEQQVFAGYGNVFGRIDASANGSYFQMFLADRKRQLMSPRFALPWLDGWNVFYAIAYLAQLGGYHIDDMAFNQYIPSVPFGPGSDLGSAEGPAYYLPVGDAGSVLTRFSGQNLWSVMSKIAYSIGYMIFPDATGALQFRKFKMPAGIKRSFYESDRESALYQAGGGLEGCWNMTVEKDMAEVRNVNITIGMRAFTKYEPIVYKQEDSDSIYDPLAFNHLGYPNPSVWMDSQFSDEEFAYTASVGMHQFLRLPGYRVTLSTWLQPDIFPLDMIAVQSRKLGTYNTRFMVTGVKHRSEKNGGSSVISARYIPDIA